MHGCCLLSQKPAHTQSSHLFFQEVKTPQTGALLHTELPSIRTKLKQRPGKRKATAVAAAAAAPTTVAELPWMQEWIATGASIFANDNPPQPLRSFRSVSVHDCTDGWGVCRWQGWMLWACCNCKRFKIALLSQDVLNTVPKSEASPTGRTAEDREAGLKHEAAEASASGRPASAIMGGQQGVPGVFIVHADGTVATDAGYTR